MSRRQQLPTIPVGATNKWVRNGFAVTDANHFPVFVAKSLRQAKRFFRTGSPGRDPAHVKASSRKGAYIPKSRRS